MGTSFLVRRGGENSGKTLVFDSTFIDRGTFVQPSGMTSNKLISGGHEDHVGLNFIGTHGRATGGAPHPMSGQPHWRREINLRSYSRICFYARKVVNHGGAYVGVFPLGTTDLRTTELARISVNYHVLPTTWSYYELDIMNIVEECLVVFFGGYVDRTGNSRSQTQFSNIWIEG